MTHHIRGRAALTSAVAASFLAGAALTGGGAPIASAQSPTENCATIQSKTFDGLTSLTQYTLEKKVLGDGTVAPGGEVTFRTTVRGSGGLVDRIEDFHPEGFQLVSARESVWKLLGGQQWADVTDDVQSDTTNDSVYKTSAGWTTAGETRVTLETTYEVPADAEPGKVLNTGAAFSVVGAGDRSANPIDTCVTIREPNAAEQVTGSLDDAGFGSATSGSISSSEISSEPSGFISDIINGVDLSQLLGS